jgi:hypothetical protein
MIGFIHGSDLVTVGVIDSEGHRANEIAAGESSRIVTDDGFHTWI